MSDLSGLVLRVAVVAPYPALRAGLRAILAEHGLNVVRESPSLDELVAAVVDAPYDVAIVDPGANSDAEALAEALADAPGLRPIVLGPIGSPERLPTLLAGRAWGYVPREADGPALGAAARAVATGLLTIASELSPRLLPTRAVAPVSPGAGPIEELSPREREVLGLVAEGLANKEIARKLRISEHTAKFHVAAILAKLGAASRTEAVHLAARRGLIAL